MAAKKGPTPQAPKPAAPSPKPAGPSPKPASPAPKPEPKARPVIVERFDSRDGVIHKSGKDAASSAPREPGVSTRPATPPSDSNKPKK